MATITIRWHHIVSFPVGTFSITPSFTSLSSWALTSFLRWTGTRMGEWLAFGTVPSLTLMTKGSPCIMGKG